MNLLISACALAALCFSGDVRIQWAVAALFLVLAAVSRKKVRLIPPLVISVTVTFFALLTPAGVVLFRVGSFCITQEALEAGLSRSAVLSGMVFISRFAVDSRLMLPEKQAKLGSAGRFLSAIFCWTEKLSANRISFAKGSVIKAIDDMLLKIWTEGESVAE